MTIPGIRVGHWTDETAGTGCTVVLLPEGTVACAEVRGGAPASRELDALAVDKSVQVADAVLLTGGSAFGLAAADGVMAFLEREGRGVPTPTVAVPIVPTIALYDLAVGDPLVRPGRDEGLAACEAASSTFHVGRVGAGTGATIAKCRGPQGISPGGLVWAEVSAGDLVVGALVAVNAFGEVDRGQDLAGIGTDNDVFTFARPGTNTTIGCVLTNARLDKLGCLVVAQGAHDGLARAIVPPHSRYDGDAFVACATGDVDAHVDLVRWLAVRAVADAIRTLPADGTHFPR